MDLPEPVRVGYALAGMVPTRLIYRVHKSRRRGNDQRQGFTGADYAQLLGAAQQLAGPLVVVWNNLNSHVSIAMAELIAKVPGHTSKDPWPTWPNATSPN